MTFYETLLQWPASRVKQLIESRTSTHVESALRNAEMDLESFAALLSPAAEPYLEQMARRSQELTRQRFGNTMSLFAPIYTSNECENCCVYCGFARGRKVVRRTLNEEEILTEAKYLNSIGYRNLLLLTGESPSKVGFEYLLRAAQICAPLFPTLGVEVWPLSEEQYARLFDAGVSGLTMFQETYDRELYPNLHRGGRKADFEHRLGTPERAGRAGLRKLNLGALLGLGDWRFDAFCTGLHGHFLARQFWQSQVSISCPRLRPMGENFQARQVVTDRNLVQYICALRLFGPDFGLTLSTRESPELRDNIFTLGFTQISAGSRTNPGGYATDERTSGEQFAVSDDRPLDEVLSVLKSKGLDPVFKDWDEHGARVVG